MSERKAAKKVMMDGMDDGVGGVVHLRVQVVRVFNFGDNVFHDFRDKSLFAPLLSIFFIFQRGRKTSAELEDYPKEKDDA